MKKIAITYGLPASGKTTEVNNTYSKCSPIHMDDIRKYDLKTIKSKVLQSIKNKHHNNFVIDVLLATNNALRNLINVIKESEIEFEYTIIVFNEDREKCKLNDKYRNRFNKATTSIETMPYEKIDESLFTDIKIKFIYKDVYSLKDWELASMELGLGLEDSKYLISDSWSLGGEGRGYSGNSWVIHAEPPVEFIELDVLLEKLKPSISYLEYKRLKRECVDMEEYDGGDYYSRETRARWRCNMEKLLAFLK